MTADTPYTRTLRRAVGICGSEAALARTLNVSVAALYRWLHGETVPIEMYMKALDVVAGQRYGGPI
jgi:DNA-binding transcriptional regulator YiaG